MVSENLPAYENANPQEGNISQVPTDLNQGAFEAPAVGFVEDESEATIVPGNEIVQKTDFAPTSLDDDVTEFAKRDSAQGLITYQVIISGIDTKQIRQAVLESLTDAQFSFSQRFLQMEIQKGELKLKNLTPGQAVMVVKRLRVLPVHLDWSQNAI